MKTWNQKIIDAILINNESIDDIENYIGSIDDGIFTLWTNGFIYYPRHGDDVVDSEFRNPPLTATPYEGMLK